MRPLRLELVDAPDGTFLWLRRNKHTEKQFHKIATAMGKAAPPLSHQGWQAPIWRGAKKPCFSTSFLGGALNLSAPSRSSPSA